MSTPFTLTGTYLHLDGGRAERMVVDDTFWPRVISGKRPLPGWLVARRPSRIVSLTFGEGTEHRAEAEYAGA